MEMAITCLRANRLLVFVWLHTENDPAEHEWDAAFEAIKVKLKKEAAPLSEVRSLVISDGGAPGGVQRARIGREFPAKSSVITTVLSNPVKRGIATALSWVNPRFFFGSPMEAKRALAHLDLDDQWDVLEPAFRELQKKLPRNRALELVATVMSEPAR
jgi:hypothetical protein